MGLGVRAGGRGGCCRAPESGVSRDRVPLWLGGLPRWSGRAGPAGGEGRWAYDWSSAAPAASSRPSSGSGRWGCSSWSPWRTGLSVLRGHLCSLPSPFWVDSQGGVPGSQGGLWFPEEPLLFSHGCPHHVPTSSAPCSSASFCPFCSGPGRT